MRDLSSKIVLAHKGFFNRESERSYKENSRAVCEVSGKKDYIHIVELDVRKSADGILYCYHGSFFQYYFALRKSLAFSDIQKTYNVDRLDDILTVIPEDKMIYLDLKNDTITKEDILNSLKGKSFKKIILGNTATAPSFLDRFDGMPDNFVKVMNGKVFCTFYNLEKLKNKNYKYFEVVFPFQISKAFMRKVEENGMEFRCAGLFFRNKESYWKAIDKYDIRHVSSDFI